VWFYTLNIDAEAVNSESFELQVVSSVSVSDKLIVRVYHKGSEISQNDLKWLLPSDLQLTRWSQLENLLIRYKNFKNSTTTTGSAGFLLSKAEFYVSSSMRVIEVLRIMIRFCIKMC
jgi:hypothetical protein